MPRKKSSDPALNAAMQETAGQAASSIRPNDPGGLAEESDTFSKNEARRADDRKAAIHRGIVWLVNFAAFSLCAILAVRVYHMITPTKMQWLEDVQMQALDKILFSSTLGAFVARYIGVDFKPEGTKRKPRP